MEDSGLQRLRFLDRLEEARHPRGQFVPLALRVREPTLAHVEGRLRGAYAGSGPRERVVDDGQVDHGVKLAADLGRGVREPEGGIELRLEVDLRHVE